MAENTAAKNITILWDSGTAYEFFASLHVLHNPDTFGIRASWAAGIRSRIPAADRKFLEDILPFFGVSLGWVYRMSTPKDALSALWALRQTPPEKRILKIACEDVMCDDPYFKALLQVYEQRACAEADIDSFYNQFLKEKKRLTREQLSTYLSWWARPVEFGEALLSAFQAYYTAFFEDEEKRIVPILNTALERAQQLSNQMNPEDLFVELSRGVHLGAEWDNMTELVMVPAYWTTPLILFEPVSKERMLVLFGARPSNMSAIPGESVPDGLVQTLKAIADPTRLKILYYLSHEELNPSELARRLHLRAPTVTHHLSELRLAGLVNLTINGQEKLYTTRREALRSTCQDIESFLDSKE